MPVGKSPEGLPIGVQIVARPWQEELVISVAAVLEAQCGCCWASANLIGLRP